ncbi:hypothetical protein BC938DRAFT_484211 [Jimgerdemannia flammicorona]|uniref:Uncharacterized protein n=1 Tax=Jimgerdemannia flammicorona TaxID=994334 RepID=A0A433QVF2_9FUNG|nr:hypothetical protein BC938DRAFT_484211 [Jimgerdemannia flammicorona]
MHGGQSLGLVDGYGVLYSEFLREAFRFLTTNPHQAIVLHLSDNAVNNNAYRVNLMQVDDIVDSVCKEFVPNAPKGACPLIHIQPPAPQAWPTLKQLVSLDDKNAKIKSRAIITNSGDFHAPDGYQTKYISPMFWQNSWFEDQSTSTIEPHLNQMCKNSISIGYEDLARKINNPSYLNESIFAPQGCNIRATPTQTRISMLMVDFYQTHFAWIKDTLQSQLLEINWNKYKQTIVKPKKGKKGKGKKGGN